MLESIYNFLPIHDHLATAGHPTEAQLAGVAAAGFDCVINLSLHGTDYALADEHRTVTALGMEYVHIPVIWDQPTSADFDKFFRAMSTHAGNKIFVHCVKNMRVAVFVAVYRYYQGEWTTAQVWAHIREIWEPEGVWLELLENLLAGKTA